MKTIVSFVMLSWSCLAWQVEVLAQSNPLEYYAVHQYPEDRNMMDMYSDMMVLGGCACTPNSNHEIILFTIDQDVWVAVDTIPIHDTNRSINFGSDVAIHGGNIIVGDDYYYKIWAGILAPPANTGSVHLYTYDSTSTTWVENYIYTPNYRPSGDYPLPGRKVEMSSSYAVASTTEGAVVFENDGTDWSMAQELTEYYGSNHSRSVAISDQHVAFSRFSGSGVGRVFVWAGSGSYSGSGQQFSSPLSGTYDEFGATVVLEGDLLYVSDPGADAATIDNQGAVFIYEHDGTSWTLAQQILHPGPVADGRFGGALAVHGDYMIVHAEKFDKGATAVDCQSNGLEHLDYVYVYKKAGSTYTLVGEFYDFGYNFKYITMFDDWVASLARIDVNGTGSIRLQLCKMKER